MADPPGKVLSSLTPSDKRNSKLGACADVFFHLFDWNRRFNGKRLLPHKSLPAERPSRKLKDEKLPMAKLLLIADENRGGFPKTPSKEYEDGLPKEKTPEKKSRKRSPGVVAKLMGLETMPSPEPRREIRDHETTQIRTGGRWRQDLSQERCYSMRNFVPTGAPIEERTMRIDRKSAENYPGRENVPVSTQDLTSYSSSRYRNEDTTRSGPLMRTSSRLDDPKPTFFSRLPPLSPRQPDSTLRSILSPSKCHNRLVSPIKSPLASKNAVRLFEAAAKILEPSMQPRTRVKTSAIQSNVARPLLEDADAEEKTTKKSSSAVSLPRGVLHDASRNPKVEPPSENPTPTISDQRHCKQFGSLRMHSASGAASNESKPPVKLKQGRKLGSSGYFRPENRNGCQDSAPQQAPRNLGSPAFFSKELLRRSSKGRAEQQAPPNSSCQRLTRSKSGREDKAGNNRFNHSQEQLRSGQEEKVRSDSRKQQEQTNRRLSQSASTLNPKLKKVGAKQDRDPSPPQERFHQSVNHDSATPKKLHSLPRVGENSGTSKSQSFGSTDSSITTASSNSIGSSGILSYSRLFGSRSDLGVSDEGSKKKDAKHRKGDSSLMKSLLRRRQITSEESASMEDNSAASSKVDMIKDPESQFPPPSPHSISGERIDKLISPDVVTKATTGDCDSSVTDGSKELTSQRGTHSIDAIDSALQSIESAGPSKILSDRNVEVDGLERQRMRARWSGHFSRSVESDSSELSSRMCSNTATTENVVQSSCESSVGDLRDTASSYLCPDVGGTKRESVSYSGKTTAAILQELLLALNSSRSQFAMETKPENWRTNSTESCSESVNCGRRAGTTSSHKDSTAIKQSHDGRKLSFQDWESLSGTVCNDEGGQPSPISILTSPFQDESSNLSDNLPFIRGKDTRMAFEDNSSSCATGGQTEGSTHTISRGVSDCSMIMDTISCLHHIDRSFIGLDDLKAKKVIENEEEYIKEIISNAKLSSASICSARLPQSDPLIDASLFSELEKQVQDWNSWGASSDDAMSTCRSERYISSRNHRKDSATMQKRKLIFDCVNEALSLDFGVTEGFSGFCSWAPFHPSDLPHLQNRVHRQIGDWRKMVCGMNVDDIVEKEMNTGVGRWCDFGSQVSELAEDMEHDIFKKLIEEFVCEVISKGR